MVKIGNFFFRYRNILFVFLYLLLFLPSPDLFREKEFGQTYYVWPLILGLIITFSGQLLRGITIGLAYIMRGGREGKVYAEDLITTGMFRHSRNPLYVGNILMLLGVGILDNSLIYVLLVMPVFFLIYHSIVLAEEAFLMRKFGNAYNDYINKVNRWIPSFKNIRQTFSGHVFNFRRWILKEYNTQYVWLSGIVLIMLINYPQLTHYDIHLRNLLILILLPFLGVCYLVIRYLKKSRRLSE